MRGAARIATYLGRLMIAVGLVLMFLGWNFAANEDCVQCQFPYLLSSSVPGMALVVVGVALEYVQTLREITARRAREAAALDGSLSRLVGFVRDGEALRPLPDFDPDDTIPPPPEHDLSVLDASGSVFAPPPPDEAIARGSGSGGQAAPAAVLDDDETLVAPAAAAAVEVVAGRSSYHQLDCRLVTNRDDMRTLPRDAAEASGLAACRICKP